MTEDETRPSYEELLAERDELLRQLAFDDLTGLEEIKGQEGMTDGELFQNLWQAASGKERDEHRSLNG